MGSSIHDLDPHEKVDMTKEEVDELVYACMSVMAVAASLTTRRWPKWGVRFFAGLGALGLIAAVLEDGADD